MGRYTKQFKEQAVKLVIGGQDPTYAARELGLPYSTLRNWLEKAGWRKPEPEGPVSEDPAVLAAQVKELRRQVKRLEMEKNILRKATREGVALSRLTSPPSIREVCLHPSTTKGVPGEPDVQDPQGHPQRVLRLV